METRGTRETMPNLSKTRLFASEFGVRVVQDRHDGIELHFDNFK